MHFHVMPRKHRHFLDNSLRDLRYHHSPQPQVLRLRLVQSQYKQLEVRVCAHVGSTEVKAALAGPATGVIGKTQRAAPREGRLWAAFGNSEPCLQREAAKFALTPYLKVAALLVVLAHSP